MAALFLALIALLWLLAAEVFWLDGRPKGEPRSPAGAAAVEVRATSYFNRRRKESAWWLLAEGARRAAGRIACTRPAQ